MNTQHFQYIVEIERTRSISQAAKNLYLSQPNLSRVLHELEEQLGFAIFERTSRGVMPTDRGALFLRYARRILMEMESIEALGRFDPAKNRLRICFPRSGRYLDVAARFLAESYPDGALDAEIHECHAKRTLEMLDKGDTELGIIRFRSEYEEYFRDQAALRSLHFEVLRDYRYQLMMRADHPLAGRAQIFQKDLAGFTEIAHGDTFRRSEPPGEDVQRRIYSVDRLAQVRLLHAIPGAYTWISPALPEDLARWELVQRDCADNGVYYRDALIYRRSYTFTEMERQLLRRILTQMKEEARLLKNPAED